MTRAVLPRRGTRGLLAATAALVVLAGCAGGSDDTDGSGGADGGSADTPDGGEGSGGAEGLLPAAEGTTQYPLTVQSRSEAVLEERPERIAVIGFSTNLDVLEVIGVTPVYTQTEEQEWEWRDQEWFDAIETIDTATRRDPVNVEGIAAADPDLIVALNFPTEDADYERLSSVAPVLEVEEELSGDQADWRELQRQVGEALDLSAASETAITDAEEAVAAVAADHPEYAGRTITIATEYTTGVEYYTVTGGTAETFVTDLGFDPNPLAADFVDDPKVADENVNLLDADVLVLSYMDAPTREAREADELFRSVPVVADGRYVAVVSDEEGAGGNATWVMRRGASALSLPWAAEVIADTWLDGVEFD
ncbi:ABC transporter substrate-binding protein [Streptomyces lonarensis]|uniref:ABC transporter substrate-binding protein n=1 Tax=Streptomyces lonarensis TaxID=700599 RepID=A0A7X6I026_9ACTN|nr:ABC transporter substrate-binding protein [Streptomyces lonarensis]NJQ06854.1 ABC transporter substrate-binding protein [Streptomyces lonarensis]